MKLIYTIILLSMIIVTVSAGLFGPDPTITPTPEPTIADTWTPIDKCWVYQSGVWDDGSNKWIVPPGYVFSITYMNKNGHRKIEQVDIDTWYNFNVYFVNQNTYMFHQGSGSD